MPGHPARLPIGPNYPPNAIVRCKRTPRPGKQGPNASDYPDLPKCGARIPAQTTHGAQDVPGGPSSTLGTYSTSWIWPSKVRLSVMSRATSG